MGKISTLIFFFLLFSNFNILAQDSKQDAKKIVKEVTLASDIFADIFSSKDTTALRSHLLTWEQYQAYQKQFLDSSDVQAYKKQMRFSRSYFEQMNQKVMMSLLDAQKNCTQKYGTCSGINFKDAKVEMKSNEKGSKMYVVSRECEKNYKKNMLLIQGMIQWENKWYLIGAYHFIPSKN